MADNDGDFGAFLSGFLFGGLIGAAAALLFAPKSGDEIRAEIMDRGIELRDRADTELRQIRSQAEDVLADVRTQAEDLQKKAKQAVDDAQAKVTSAVGEGKQKAAEAVEEVAEELDADATA